MDKNFLTSDDRLLKIIEKSSVAGKGEEKDVSLPGKKHPFAIKDALDFKKLKARLTLGVINKALLGVCVLITVFWVLDFVKENNMFRTRMKKMQAISPMQVDRASSEILKNPVNLSELLYEADNRNMFSLTQTKIPVEQAQSEDYSAALKDFRLVGIIWSEEPQAMIENLLEGKTYLVSVNDSMGKFTVRKILEDRVFVGKDSQQWELR